jgi:hypothetical protein
VVIDRIQVQKVADSSQYLYRSGSTVALGAANSPGLG